MTVLSERIAAIKAECQNELSLPPLRVGNAACRAVLSVIKDHEWAFTIPPNMGEAQRKSELVLEALADAWEGK